MIESEQLLVNLGTPSSPTAEGVREFLAEFLADPLVVELPRLLWLPILHGIILRKRPSRIAELYASIWEPEGSPLRLSSERIARAVNDSIGPDAAASAAYRYGSPSLMECIEAALERSAAVVVTPLFPQRTASSTGTIERLVARLPGAQRRRVRYAALDAEAPGYIDALAARLAEATSARPTPDRLLLSFHGIPAAVDRREGETYSGDCRRTVRALVERSGFEPQRAQLCYQSRFGRQKWLGPPTEETLIELAHSGVKRVAVMTPGFLTEGLETLEEIGVRARAAFIEAGGEELVRVPCVTDHPGLIAELAALARNSAAS